MQTRVEFSNARGERLVGVLHGPPRLAMAISCHGMFSNKDGIKHTQLAGAMQARNISVLRFDFNGRGESGGSLENLSYTRRVEDLDAAIDFLAAQGVRHVGLFGSSMGGAVALLAAARDERIMAVATLSAMAHPGTLLESFPAALAAWENQGFYDAPEGRIGRGFVEDSRAHDVAAAVAVLRAPILVMHGDADEVVSCADAHDLATAARSATLDLVLGADHAFSQPTHMRPAIQRIATFLAAHLKVAQDSASATRG